MSRGFVRTPGDGTPLPAAGGELLASAADTGGALSVVRSEAPAGDTVPLHVHHELDECFYVLHGHYLVRCGDDEFDAGPGSFVYLPRGVPHGYRVGDEPGGKLILGMPGGLEDFFADMDAGYTLDEIAHRHHVTFLGDPA